MLLKTKKRWIWLIISFFLFFCAVQTASSWDMIPPVESVRNATDEFDQAWRLEAGRKFSEPRNIGTNYIISYIFLTFLIVVLSVLFHLMVKLNHMERTSKRVRADMLWAYTKMWLISRWGFRY